MKTNKAFDVNSFPWHISPPWTKTSLSPRGLCPFKSARSVSHFVFDLSSRFWVTWARQGRSLQTQRGRRQWNDWIVFDCRYKPKKRKERDKQTIRSWKMSSIGREMNEECMSVCQSYVPFCFLFVCFVVDFFKVCRTVSFNDEYF
jgi:hypothetical protein